MLGALPVAIVPISRLGDQFRICAPYMKYVKYLVCAP